LENIDQKDHGNKVQFLNGISKILDRFDKKSLVKRVIPLLLDTMKVPQLSVAILPSVIALLEKPEFISTIEFQEHIWPAISKLCKAKELPAQSLFLMLSHTETFVKYLTPPDFQGYFFPLILKSLECGVPKLQILALSKVQYLVKQIDYQSVKTMLIPRMLNILEKQSST